MVFGLDADVVHRQLQSLLVAEDGLVLRAMIGEGPPDILHPGDRDHIAHKNGDAQHRVHQIPDQYAVRKTLHEAGKKGGQQHEQAHGEAHCQHYGEADDQLLHFFIPQLLVQPAFKSGGLLCSCLLGEVVGGEHESLDALDHAVEKGDAAPNQGQPQNGIPVFDESQFLFLDDQTLGAPDYDALFFRAPHQDALDKRLPTDGGSELFF